MTFPDDRGPEREVELPQGRVRYRERGEGRPIVFVHGFYVDGNLWHDVVPALSEQFRCITPDLPLGSHRVAMPPDADLSPPAVASLVANFIETLGLEDVMLVGNDSGGAICQLTVTAHPDRIGALVLTPCDAFEHFPPVPYNVLRYVPRIPGAIATTNALLKTKLGRRLTFRPLLRHGYDDDLVRSWVEPAQRDRAIARDGAKFAVQMHPKFTLAAAKLLPGFERPVLITWSRDCKFFKFATAERLAATFPNARIEAIDDGWMFLPLDQPAALAGAIAKFAAVDAAAVG